MAKTNIILNNTTYSIDESSLAPATAELRTHLSTNMAGSGATINLGGTAYNVDSAKLTSATNDFVAHLGKIAGSGAKVTVGGVEYGVDSAKIASAMSGLGAAFGKLENPTPDAPTEERLEGDGAEFYTLAPTALSFRSTAPLNELQEVQINGVTVDPANYTLEEGSTIVTFPIDYLKTLDVGSYEVTIASESKTVKGDFTVAAPELNEHGFYYNQPYTAYVEYFNAHCSFMISDDGYLTAFVIESGDREIISYTVSENNIKAVSTNMGELNFTISDNGSELYNIELATSLSVNEMAMVVCGDYAYIYNSSLDGYEVVALSNKGSYEAIKTGFYDLPTVKIPYAAFANSNVEKAPIIPDSVIIIDKQAFVSCDKMVNIVIPSSVTSIGDEAFYDCTSLESITFNGTMTQWNAITKGNHWNKNVPATYVQCSDGQVSL